MVFGIGRSMVTWVVRLYHRLFCVNGVIHSFLRIVHDAAVARLHELEAEMKESAREKDEFQAGTPENGEYCDRHSEQYPALRHSPTTEFPLNPFCD